MTRLVVVTLLLAIVAVALKSRTKGTKSNRTIRVTSRVTINVINIAIRESFVNAVFASEQNRNT